MTSLRFYALVVVVTVSAALLGGCEVQTESQPPAPYAPANHVVINELYTLPPTNPTAHSWLEIYNPTSKPVDLKKWSLTFRTTLFPSLLLVYYDTVGHRGQILPSRAVQFSPGQVDTTVDVPIFRLVDFLALRVILIGGATYDTTLAASFGNLEIGPGEFLTLVDDLDRLRVFNTIGPGSGPTPESSPLLPLSQDLVTYTVVSGSDTARFQLPGNSYRAVIYQRDTTLIVTQRNIPDTVFSQFFRFFLPQSGQLILKDSAGNAVDVVRYGNYVYQGPGADPYPANQSIGAVPLYESIARYAGAYDTHNSANDFYVTRAGLRPIPHWISQLWKK